jgi:F0F1-type ATP synthase epsilon subunit
MVKTIVCEVRAEGEIFLGGEVEMVVATLRAGELGIAPTRAFINPLKPGPGTDF